MTANGPVLAYDQSSWCVFALRNSKNSCYRNAGIRVGTNFQSVYLKYINMCLKK